MRTRRASTSVALAALFLMSAAALADDAGQKMAEAAGRDLIGSPAPRIVLETIDGGTIDLGSLYGKKAVYLKFWATWCVPCRQQMPHFEHAYETAGADLAVIAVDVGFNDSVEEIRKYRKQLGITMPIVFDSDGQVGAAFHLRVTPQHIVIGRDGRIRYVGHLADQGLDAHLAEDGPELARHDFGQQLIDVRVLFVLEVLSCRDEVDLLAADMHRRDARSVHPHAILRRNVLHREFDPAGAQVKLRTGFQHGDDQLPAAGNDVESEGLLGFGAVRLDHLHSVLAAIDDQHFAGFHGAL